MKKANATYLNVSGCDATHEDQKALAEHPSSSVMWESIFSTAFRDY